MPHYPSERAITNEHLERESPSSLDRLRRALGSRIMSLVLLGSVGAGAAGCKLQVTLSEPDVEKEGLAEGLEVKEKTEEELDAADLFFVRNSIALTGDEEEKIDALEKGIQNTHRHFSWGEFHFIAIQFSTEDWVQKLHDKSYGSNEYISYNQAFFEKWYQQNERFREKIQAGLQSGKLKFSSMPPFLYQELGSEEWFFTLVSKKIEEGRYRLLRHMPLSAYEKWMESGQLRKFLEKNPKGLLNIPHSVFNKIKTEKWFQKVADQAISGRFTFFALYDLPTEFSNEYYRKNKKALKKQALKILNLRPEEILWAFPPDMASEIWVDRGGFSLNSSSIHIDIDRMPPEVFWALWSQESFQISFETKLRKNPSYLFYLPTKIFAFFWNKNEFKDAGLLELEKEPGLITYVDADYTNEHLSEEWVQTALNNLAYKDLNRFLLNYLQFDWATEKVREVIKSDAEKYAYLNFVLKYGEKIDDGKYMEKLLLEFVYDYPLQAFFYGQNPEKSEMGAIIAKAMSDNEKGVAFMLDPGKATLLFGKEAEENCKRTCEAGEKSLKGCLNRVPRTVLLNSPLVIEYEEHFEETLQDPEFFTKFTEKYPYFAFRNSESLKSNPGAMKQAVRENPKYTLMHADKLMKHFGTEWAEWVNQAAKREPVYGLMYLPLFADSKEATKWLQGLSVYEVELQASMITYRKNLLLVENGEAILKELAESILAKDDRHLIDFAKKFAGEPWAKDLNLEERARKRYPHLFREAAEAKPRLSEAELREGIESGKIRDAALLDNFDLISDMAWLEAQLERILATKPSLILQKANKIPEPWGEKFIPQAMSRLPKMALAHCSRFAERAWALPEIDKAFRAAGSRKGESEDGWKLEFGGGGVNVDRVNQCRRRAKAARGKSASGEMTGTEEAAGSGRGSSFWLSKLTNKEEDLHDFFDHFGDIPHSIAPEHKRRMVAQAFSIHPTLTIQRIESFAGEPWTGELIESWINPLYNEFIMREIKHFADHAYAEKIARKVMEDNEGLIFEHFADFPNKPWADKVWLEAAEKSAALAFVYFPNIQNKPKLKKKALLVIASSLDTDAMEAYLLTEGTDLRSILEENTELEKIYARKVMEKERYR